MSREIKFRVWNADSKKYWNIENWHVEDEYIDLIDPNNSNADPNAKRIWKRESDVVIEQFTGLKDITGLRVYVGDIVKVEGHPFEGSIQIDGNYEVGFDQSSLMYVAGSWQLAKLRPYITAVGNVHENPELLKKVEQ
jgi:uncharacterized phage protein (TIGR01671 family)